MHVFLKYFSLLIEQFSLYGKSSNNKLASANTIRKILMRTKPLLSLKPGSLENRKVIQSSLSLYKDSIELLDGVPFEVNYFDHSAFSFEEESNVTIPNALFELSYEYFPTFVSCLKSLSDANCLGISITLIEIFKKIAQKNSDFFEVEKKFEKKIFPYLKVMLLSKNFSAGFGIRIKVESLKFIVLLSFKCIRPVIEELKNCYSKLLFSNNEEIIELLTVLKQIIDQC